MMDKSVRLDKEVEQRLDDGISQIVALCSQPSVSATGEGIQECASLVSEILERYGLEVSTFATSSAPIVLGRAEGRSNKTLLFYNHYDVQPTDPLEQWETPPFEPDVREGRIFGRGAADDKGELVARLLALEVVREINGGTLPCGVIFVVEGEEEIGSPNIAGFVLEHLELLRCDGAIWEDGIIDPEGRPFIFLGYRGVIDIELRCVTMTRDAHSRHANFLPNAAWRLIRALTELKDEDERILVDGFYDDIEAPSEKELELVDSKPDYESFWREKYGVKSFLRGLGGLELKRTVYEPTCNIQGLTAGYQGEGGKTVIPSEATAKLDFRLLPGQDPGKVFERVRCHLKNRGFEDIEVSNLGAIAPTKTDPEDPLVTLAVRTAEEVYGKPCVLDPMASGSTPVYAFAKPLGIPVTNAGIGYWDNRIHAPNEHIRIVDLQNGVRHIARILEGFPYLS